MSSLPYFAKWATPKKWAEKWAQPTSHSPVSKIEDGAKECLNHLLDTKKYLMHW